MLQINNLVLISNSIMNYSTNRLVISLTSLFFLFQIIHAQNKMVIFDSYDKKAFLSKYPKTTFSETELTNQLYKPLIKPYYLAEEALKNKVHLSKEDTSMVLKYYEWEKIKYVAACYDSIISLQTKQNNEDEDKIKQSSSSINMLDNAQFSYIECNINNGFEKDSVDIKNYIMSLVQGKVDLNNFEKKVNERFFINIVNKKVLNKYQDDYDLILASNVGDLISQRKGNLRYYYIIDKISNSTSKTSGITANIQVPTNNQKSDSTYRFIDEMANKQFPIKFTDSFSRFIMTHEYKPYTLFSFGNIIISVDDIKYVQSAFNQFHFSDKSDEFELLIKQYITIPYYKTNSEKSNISREDSTVLHKILIYNFKKYLSDKYEKILYEKMKNIEEDEVLTYYNQIKNLYQLNRTASYLKADLLDTSVATINELKKEFLLISNKQDPNLKIKKEGKFIITNEIDHSFNAQDKLYQLILNTPINALSKIYYNQGSITPIIIYPYTISSIQYKPFEMVKDECKQQLINARIENYVATLKSTIFNTHTFKIVE